MRRDERQLLETLGLFQTDPSAIPLNLEYRFNSPLADEVGQFLGIHPNRVLYLLEKWADKDWWAYGVSLRTGSLTYLGLQQAGYPL